MMVILIILSAIALIVGLLTTSQATMGVGILAIACYFAILSRLAQAAKHQNEIKKLSSDQYETTKLLIRILDKKYPSQD